MKLNTSDAASTYFEPVNIKPQIINQETMMNYPENCHAHEVTQGDADVANETYVPSYRLLVHEPTVLLAGNPNDRSDVATVAILFYN